MTRVLVLGSAGQMGKALLACGVGGAVDMTGLNRNQCDITSAFDVQNVVEKAAPDVVINTAALTAVDAAEAHADLAFAVNCEGARNVAKACANQGVALIHLSTDYVFGNAPARRFIETDPVGALNIYGQTKAQGEDAIRGLLDRHVILRTAWVYGANSVNFFMTMMHLADTLASITVVEDEKSCPTHADDLAQTIVAIAQNIGQGEGKWGTFHACGQEGLSRFAFAQAIMDARKTVGLKSPELRTTTQAAYKAAALRPNDSRMDCNALEVAYGRRLAGISTVLPDLIARIGASKT
jgi:dTDP-4-dehydrorhamnose reductase